MAILKTNLNDGYELLQPWSVPVFRTVIPKNVFDSVYDLSENVLQNPNSESWGHQLAGQIKTEKHIDLTLLNSYGINTFFKNILTQFILECKTQMMPENNEKVMSNDYDVNIKSMWIVSQKPGEYNPIHYHTNCKISGVMYLKLPDILPSIKNNKDDGSITFFNAGTRDLEFSNPNLKCIPKVGELYIFGAHQQHMVYPYRSTESTAERRSISFNADFNDMPGNIILG